MNPHSNSAEDLFFMAADLATPELQAEFLDRECAGNAALRARVERLLARTRKAGGFLGGKTLIVGPGNLPGITPMPVTEQSGERIGRYKLLQQIGEGGFGTVWMAEQMEPVTRRVALKIIKLGMDTREVIARFEVERQALAMMDHPNIAKVLDAGATESGRPFFVMELVRGMPLTTFCDDQKLDIRQRLELFADICSAVNHAHQKGIIHRDLKPSNILVTLHGDKPVPKIIDFGIAKATQERLTEKTLFTRFEQFVGTPVYMSPEQATLSGLDIDTRSDIYSLGVILYEVLTGKPPFDTGSLMNAGYDEMRRIIRDEEPPRPSTRLRALDEKERPTIAATHRCDTHKLERLLKGDLDWIVMKSLEKDRSRRYETANALAQDIRRHLTHQPVTAVAPSLVYSFRKFARRHSAAVTLSAVLLASLILGLTGALSGMARVKAALKSEAEQKQQAEWERDAKESALAAVSTQRDLVRKEADRSRQLLYAADVLLSSHLWQSDDGSPRQIAELLKRSVPGPEEQDLREFTWHYQWALLGRSSSRHQGPPDCVALGVNGTGHLVTARVDGTVEMWESGRRDAAQSLKPNGGQRPSRMALSRSGALLAAVMADGSADIRKIATGETIHQLGILPPQLALKFSSNDKYLGAIGGDSLLRMWEVETGKLVHEFELAGASVAHWDFCGENPKVLLTNPNENHVALYSPQSPEPHILFQDKGGFTIYQCVLSADARIAVLGNAGGDVHVFDCETRTRLRRLHVPSAALRLDLSSGNLLAIGETSGQISVWDVNPGSRLRTLKGHENTISRVAFSLDGKSLATLDKTGGLRGWNMAADENVRSRQTGEIDSIAYSPDGRWMANGGRGRVLLTDLKSGGEPVQIDTESARVVTFSADSRLLAAGGTSGEVRIWKPGLPDSKQILAAPELEMKHVGGLAFEGSGNWIAVSYGSTTRFGRDHKAAVAIWDLRPPRKPPRFFPTDSQVSALKLSSDGSLLAAAAHNGTIRLWRTADWKELATWRGSTPTQYQSVCFLDGGQTLCTGTSSGRIEFWEVSTQALKNNMRAHSDCVSALALSPDGKTLATGSWDSAIKLWHVPTGRELRTLRVHHSWVYTLAFSPDGSTLASGGVDKWLNLFQASHDPVD